MAIQAGGITAYLDLNTGQFDSKLKSAQSDIGKFSGNLKTAGGAMAKAGGTLTKSLTLPILGFAAGILKVGGDFEQSMSEVQAISGATGKDLQSLEDLAREMGATTKFSASEAADGLKYMAMAGWKTKEMTAALPAVLNLAAASGEELGAVSDIVTDALTAFGMEAGDAAGFADLLASASSNSNTNVSLLGESFKYVAPLMGSLGISADDTALALGLMANAGIKGSQAGNQLKNIMANLVSPTNKQAAAMENYGIELEKNEDGTIDLSGSLDNLRGVFSNLDEEQQAQLATQIAGKESMSGLLAIVNASPEDYKKLQNATSDYNGEAQRMADIMGDNLKGDLDRLKSGVEELAIGFAETAIPMAQKFIKKLQGLVEAFGELDEEQKENIVKWGLVLAAAGPVLTVFGNLTTGVGNVFGMVGKLSGALGLASGGGLAGSLALLGPLAVGGVAIAGVVALNSAINDLRDDSLELEEHNTGLTASLVDQEVQLRKSTETFEQLTAKTNLTNKELAELNDLNKRISKSNNPGEIKQLEEAYALLAKESGLSKEELQKLFEVNEFLIEQVPHVEQVISDEGNAFVVTTEKVRDYLQALNDYTTFELELERQKLLDNEVATREKLTEEIRTQNQYAEMAQDFMDANNLGLDEAEGRMKEITELRREDNFIGEESELLLAEYNMLQAKLNGNVELENQYREEGYRLAQEMNREQSEKVQALQDEIDKLDVVEQTLVNQELARVGINEEGAKGLSQLDENITKNDEELGILNEKLKSAEGLTDEEKNRMKHLLENNTALQETKEHLYEEFGIYKDINSLADMKVDKLSEEGRLKVESLARSVGIWDVENDILGTLDKKSEKLSEEKKKLEENRKENGANKEEIDKQIKSIDSKLGKQAQVKKQIMEELGIWDDVDKSIRDGIDSEISKGNAVNGTSTQLDAQGNKIENNNQKTKTGIGLEKDRTAEAGKDVDKRVDVRDYGTVAILNAAAQEKKDKQINVRDFGSIGILNRAAEARKTKPITSVDSGGSLITLNKKAASPVRKVINFVTGLFPKFADGTPPGGHKGGMAIVGDGGGRELITLPNGRAFLSPDTDTMLDLPKGTHVTDHRKTNAMMKNIPKYAKGTLGAGASRIGFNVNTISSGIQMVGSSANSKEELHKANKELLEIQAKTNLERVTNEEKANEDMLLIAKRLNTYKQKDNQELNKQIKELQLSSNEKIKMIEAKARDDKRKLNNKEKREIIEIKRATNRDVAELEEQKTTDLLKVMERENKKVIKLEKELQEKLDFYKRRASNNNRNITVKEKEEIEKLTKEYNGKIAKAELKALEDRNRVIQENSKEFLDQSKEFAETRKKQGTMSISQEVAYWDKISRIVHSGSKEYAKALEYKQDALQRINSELVMANENYAERIRNIDRKMIDDVKKLNEEYEKAYASRRKELANFTGLFNKFAESEPMSSQDILSNMKSQVDAIQDYEFTITDLSGRIDNKDLMDELKALGPQAIGQLKSLNNMTSGELQKFVSLYEDKFRIASNQASKELKPMEKDIEDQIRKMKVTANNELKVLEKEWQSSIETIVTQTGETFKDFKDVGENAIKGLELGMLNKENDIMSTANRIAENVKATIAKSFDIHSPSRWAKNYIGMSIGQGSIEGMDSQENRIVSKAAEMAEWMKPNNFDSGNISRSSANLLEIDYDRLADAFVKGLKDEGISKPAVINLDGRSIGKGLVNILDGQLNNKGREDDIGRGVTLW